MLAIPAKLCRGFNDVRCLSKDLVTYYSSTSRPAVVVSDLSAVVQVHKNSYPLEKCQKNNGNHIFSSCPRGNSKLNFEFAPELKRRTASASCFDETAWTARKLRFFLFSSMLHKMSLTIRPSNFFLKDTLQRMLWDRCWLDPRLYGCRTHGVMLVILLFDLIEMVSERPVLAQRSNFPVQASIQMTVAEQNSRTFMV